MNEEVEKIRYGCGDCQTRQMVGEICEKCGKHYCPEHLECVAMCCPDGGESDGDVKATEK